MREARLTLAVAERDHVVICGFGRVGQNIARVLEQTGFEYIALDLDTYRVREGRQAGDPVMYGDAGQIEVLQNVGLARARCVVITFANPAVSLRILRAVRALRADVPVLVRTQDDIRLEELQAAGATEVVPETLRGEPHAAVASVAVAEAADAAGHPYRERHPQPSLRDAAPVLPQGAAPNSWMTITHFVKSFTASCCRRMPGRWARASRSSPTAARRSR